MGEGVGGTWVSVAVGEEVGDGMVVAVDVGVGSGCSLAGVITISCSVGEKHPARMNMQVNISTSVPSLLDLWDEACN